MSEFVYPVHIFSLDKEFLFREFKNKHHKAMSKVIFNENWVSFEYFINNLITELSIDGIDSLKLSAFDKFYIMLCMRAYCIGSTISFNTEVYDEEGEDKSKVAIPININDFISNTINFEIDSTFVIQDDFIKLKGTLPKRFYFEDDIFNLASDCVNEIIFKDKKIDLTGLDLEDKKKVMTSLPSFAFPRIVEYLQKQDKKTKGKPLFTIQTELQLPFDKTFDMNLFDGSMAEIIKMIYNMELGEFYQNEYVLMRKFKFGYESIINSTPGELSLMYEIINKDLEKEKKDMDQQQQSPGDMSIPQPQPPSNVPAELPGM